jgi:hypothetical protein
MRLYRYEYHRLMIVQTIKYSYYKRLLMVSILIAALNKVKLNKVTFVVIYNSYCCMKLTR